MLEGIDLKEAIKVLGDGIDTGGDYEYNEIVRQLEEQEEESSQYDVDDYSLLISRLCYQHMQGVEFDEEEIDFVDEVLEKIDDKIHGMDINSLSVIYDFLIEKGFPKRYMEWEEKKEKSITRENGTF